MSRSTSDPLQEKERLRRHVAGLETRSSRPLASGERELLDAVLETGVAAICVLDSTGQIVFANQAAERILGLERSEIVKRRYDAPEWKSTDVDGGPWPDERQPFVRVMTTGAPVRDVRHAIEWPDGRRKVLSVHGAPLRGASGRIERAIFSVTDITEHLANEHRTRESLAGAEQARHALEESNTWLNIALQSARMGTWSWNVATGELRWSDEVPVIFGLAPGTFGGRYQDYLDLVHPEDVDTVEGVIPATLLSGRDDYVIEHRLIWPDDSVHWIEGRGRVMRTDEGDPYRVAGTLMDVTDRKETERRLRRSEEEIRALVETTPSYILNVGPDHTIRFINRTVPLLKIEDVLGTPVDQFVFEEDRERYGATLDRVFATGEIQEIEMRSYRAEGDLGVFLSRIGPVLRDGEVVSATIIGTDITELKDTERALRESQDRLHLVQKMESVGRLAGGVAHDFNNLLTAVMGYADLAQAQPGLPPNADRLLDEIRSAADRGAALTQQLLAFARKQVIQPRVVDLNDLVGRAESLLCRLISEHVELEVELADEPLPVRVDPGQFEQVLVNLAINARDAMAGGGRLRIVSRRCPTDGRSGLLGPASWVEIAVIDNGVGIEKHVLERIFEPFFTTKAHGHGTGLGLSTCFGIVKQAGGTIEVESRVGGGTRFSVRLPRVDSEGPVPPLDPPSATEEIARGTERILLVEDDPSVRRAVQRALERAGYRLLVASHGLEALEVHAKDGPVDLVVSDVVMPKMGGLALARKLRERQPGLEVLLASGHATDSVDSETLNAGDLHFIQKPFSPCELARRLREIMDGGRD